MRGRAREFNSAESALLPRRCEPGCSRGKVERRKGRARKEKKKQRASAGKELGAGEPRGEEREREATESIKTNHKAHYGRSRNYAERGATSQVLGG